MAEILFLIEKSSSSENKNITVYSFLMKIDPFIDKMLLQNSTEFTILELLAPLFLVKQCIYNDTTGHSINTLAARLLS